MSKQTFTAGNVLTAAEMNTLQTNDFNQTVSTKTASYVLVADDKGTRVVMNSGSATTITVNNSVFEAGDSLRIQNIGSGACTITAGTATVATTGKLELAQYGGGELYFTSASSAIFFPFGGAATMIKKVDRFTASGSWTVPAGVTYAVAHILGGGGGGGGGASYQNGSTGGTSSVAFASGTVSGLGGKGGQGTNSSRAEGAAIGAGSANSGRGGPGCSGVSGDCNGFDAQYIVAGAVVTPAASITVTVGAGGTAGTNGAAGGTGYVWIEYLEEA